MKKLSTALGATMLVALASFSAPALAAEETGNEGQVCGPLSSGKIDTTGDPQTVTLQAPEGQVVTSYCIKAGSAQQGEGPVVVVLSPAQQANTVVVGHPTGKAVSHYSFAFGPAPTVTETETETSTETPGPTPTTNPEVLGESDDDNDGGSNNGGNNNGGNNNGGNDNGGNDNGGVEVLGEQASAGNTTQNQANQRSAPAAQQVPTVINAGTSGETAATTGTAMDSAAIVALVAALMALLLLTARTVGASVGRRQV